MDATKASNPPYALVPEFEARLAVMEKEYEAIDRNLAFVRDKIDASINRLRKKPGVNGDEVKEHR